MKIGVKMCLYESAQIVSLRGGALFSDDKACLPAGNQARNDTDKLEKLLTEPRKIMGD